MQQINVWGKLLQSGSALRISLIGVFNKTGSTEISGSVACIAAILVATVIAYLTPRSYLGEGFEPAIVWKTYFACLILLSLAFPIKFPFMFPEKLWRFTPLLVLFAPFTSLNVQLAIGMVTISAVLLLLPWNTAKIRGKSLAYGATLWSFGLLVSNLYAHFDSRLGPLPGAAELLYGALFISGASVHIQNGLVYVNHESANNGVLPTLDKFGGEFFAVFLLVMLLGLAVVGVPRRTLTVCAASSLIYTLLRSAWVVMNLIGVTPANWWDERVTFLTFLPLAILCAFLLRGKTSKDRSANTSTGRPMSLVGLACALIGIALVWIGWTWIDPGTKKSGSIVLDEAHSDWEWSDSPLEQEWYGTKTVYNYYDFQAGLQHYYDVELNHRTIDSQLLSKASVLILKTPTKPYSTEERDAIWDFVERGGGLWLIGDHTDAFGMSTYLNSICNRYDVNFNIDAVLDPTFSRNLYLPSPFTHGTLRDLPLFLFYTGDSLQSPIWTNDVIQMGRLHRDKPDYSAGTFFGDLKATLDEQFGHISAALEIPAGRGRIAVWSDSTLFSNYAVFVPGKFEVALSTIDWLNRRNSELDLRWPLFITGLVLSSIGLAYLDIFSLAAVGLLAICIGGQAARLLSNAEFPSPSPRYPFNEIAFLEKGHTEHLPIDSTIDEAMPSSYLSVYLASQRVGLRPRVAASVEDATRQKLVVYVPDSNELSLKELERLRTYVSDGGTLLILDAGRAPKKYVMTLGSEFGFQVIFRPPTDAVYKTIKGNILNSKGKSCGTEPITTTVDGDVPVLHYENSSLDVGAEKHIGSGKVVITTTTRQFSDAGVGFNQSIPTDSQFEVLKMIFQYCKDAFKGRSRTTL